MGLKEGGSVRALTVPRVKRVGPHAELGGFGKRSVQSFPNTYVTLLILNSHQSAITLIRYPLINAIIALSFFFFVYLRLCLFVYSPQGGQIEYT